MYPVNHNMHAPPFYRDPNCAPPPPGSGTGGALPTPMMAPSYPPTQLPPPPPLYPTANRGGFAPPTGFVGGPVLIPSNAAICTNCSSSGHLRRNCPTITCLGCGRLGHFKQDCPTTVDGTASSVSGGSPDIGRRVRSREQRDTHQSGLNGVDDDVDGDDEGEYRWSVCRNCGSSRHIQAQCPSRYQTLECFQCHKRGHLMSSCPLTRCYNCGTYGHSSQVCHSMPHCFHCANVGHRSTECPVRTKGRVCYQCNEPGHEAAQCPQGQLCRMCRQPGHLVAQCPQVTCYQCHEKGHTAGACERDQCEHCGGHHNALMCVNVTDTNVASFYRSSSAESSLNGDVVGAPASPTSSLAAPDAAAAVVVGLPAVATTTPSAGEATDAQEEEDKTSSDQNPPTIRASTPRASAAAAAVSGGPTDELSASLMRPYTPTGVNRGRSRVAVVIDGPYFERCVRRDAVEYGTEGFYRHVTAALRNTLDFIGDIFEKTPIGYWFDTDPAAFTEFVETAMPLAHRERAFRESSLRKRLLTGEMNSGRGLHNVLPRLVGTMKKQRGYTQDGPGHVWVQSGVDVALATTLVELFHDRRQFDQVVLLCGDSDVYPAVHYCNTQRVNNQAYKEHHPVRVCGTSSSLAKQYGQHQDLYDFLPPVLLNQPCHREGDKSIDFPPYSAFR